jgi:hypothetical protein
MNPKLESPCRMFRSTVLRKPARGVEREGGQYGAGLIRGAAILTRGEALGHEMWVDGTMLQQAAALINESVPGIRSRFGHPGLSGDGIGKGLGRFQNAVVDGDTVRADLHLRKSAHSAPDGNLAGHVMDLAEEDSGAFGNSIVFDADLGAEDLFYTEHEDRDGRFHSPDKENQKGLRHARIAALKAVDVVDSPAANPDGLFHQGHELILEADALAAYALGLSDQYTELGNLGLGLAPERVREFMQRFLNERGLYIARKPVPAIAAARASIDTDAD